MKLEEIQETGHGGEVEEFRNLGILLDTEADVFTATEASHKSSTRYIHYNLHIVGLSASHLQVKDCPSLQN